MAQIKDRQELYASFLKFIQEDSQKDRMQVHQQMFSTLLWCFLVPVFLAGVILFFTRMGFVSSRWRSYLDPILLIFPVLYSLYYLGSQVIVDLPYLFRKGGLSTSLRQTLKEGKWRHATIESLSKQIPAKSEDWAWVADNFEIDLRIHLQRTRFLTVLGGAVFFLLSQGFDAVETKGPSVSTGMPVGAEVLIRLVEYGSSQIASLVALFLFLVLLYLTGSQLYHTLHRYLDCADLLSKE